MKSRTAITASCVVLSLAMSTPAAAKPEPDAVSSADNATIDTFLDELFARLKAGKSLDAVTGFLGHSKLMAPKTQQTTFLASQIDSAVGVYGPFSRCVLFSQEDRAGIVQARSYLCQHRDYLTRWNFSFGKTAGGWEPLTIDFDDKVTEGL